MPERRRRAEGGSPPQRCCHRCRLACFLPCASRAKRSASELPSAGARRCRPSSWRTRGRRPRRVFLLEGTSVCIDKYAYLGGWGQAGQAGSIVGSYRFLYRLDKHESGREGGVISGKDAPAPKGLTAELGPSSEAVPAICFSTFLAELLCIQCRIRGGGARCGYPAVRVRDKKGEVRRHILVILISSAHGKRMIRHPPPPTNSTRRAPSSSKPQKKKYNTRHCQQRPTPEKTPETTHLRRHPRPCPQPCLPATLRTTTTTARWPPCSGA